MPFRSLTLRFACSLTLAVWVGGFAFYGGAVIPILHDAMDSLQAGGITRRVTDVLNAVGVATLAVWSLAAWLERSSGPPRVRRARLILLGITLMLLLFLIVLHGIMNERLETGSLRGFYPLHRVYLIASTVQWVANLGLMATSLVLWGHREQEPDANEALGRLDGGATRDPGHPGAPPGRARRIRESLAWRLARRWQLLSRRD
ncbi:MAG: DUF4149 domain-containing protein [Isosphaeraceae bacterium]